MSDLQSDNHAERGGTTDAPPNKWVRVLSVARWISLVVCVSILGFRYIQLELDDYVVAIEGDADTVGVDIAIVPPSGPFTHPTSLELAAIGDALVSSPRERRQAARRLHAITSRPVLINDDISIYLTRRAAYWQLRRDPDIRGNLEVAGILWDAAERLDYTYKIESARAVGAQD